MVLTSSAYFIQTFTSKFNFLNQVTVSFSRKIFKFPSLKGVFFFSENLKNIYAVPLKLHKIELYILLFEILEK